MNVETRTHSVFKFARTHYGTGVAIDETGNDHFDRLHDVELVRADPGTGDWIAVTEQHLRTFDRDGDLVLGNEELAAAGVHLTRGPWPKGRLIDHASEHGLAYKLDLTASTCQVSLPVPGRRERLPRALPAAALAGCASGAVIGLIAGPIAGVAAGLALTGLGLWIGTSPPPPVPSFPA